MTLRALRSVALVTPHLLLLFLFVGNNQVRSLPFDVNPASPTFASLGCNADGYTACQSWSSFRPDPSDATTAIVPCGSCVTLDITDGSTIDLPGGLNVLGKLLVPPEAKVTLHTPIILVEGEFELQPSADPIVSPDNAQLKIVMTGDQELAFAPHAENSGTCVGGANSDSCTVGKKAIVVAGGKLSIDGWNDDACPTWVKLRGSVSGAMPVAGGIPSQPTVLEGCSSTVVTADFTSDNGNWMGSAGTTITLDSTEGIDGQYLKIADRTKTYQGALLDLPLNGCIEANTTYVFSARARLHSTNVQPSRCSTKTAEGNNNCLHLRLATQPPGAEVASYKTLAEDSQTGAGVPDGQWFTFTSPIEFEDEDLLQGSIYTALLLNGPEGGVEMSLDDITLSLPPVESYPTDAETACSNLIVSNGGADAALPYPFVASPVEGTHVSIALSYRDEDGDRHDTNDHDDDPETPGADWAVDPYFRVTGRSRDHSSMLYPLSDLQGCIVRGVVYNFASSVRVHSPDAARTVRMVLKEHLTEEQDPDGNKRYNLETVAVCQPSQGTWVDCAGSFSFREEHEATYEKIELTWVVDDDGTSDLDVDDVAVEFGTGGVTQLKVPTEVGQCWGAGSEIVVTSHTLSAEDASVGVIGTVVPDDGEGNAVLELVYPVSVGDESADFASEVALLTRNVVFEADTEDDPSNPKHGGHLMVMHTPGVASVLEGVEIRGFGQQKKYGRYPINFHMNQEVAPGTRISRNTIRDSFQRCVVLYDTSAATVEHNIAHNTHGHCYVLQAGSEVDNTFDSNLGAVTRSVPNSGRMTIFDSDNQAATFYVASPNNTFTGNVAAGSVDGDGFWFELPRNVHTFARSAETWNFDPSRSPLGSFVDNVMHGNGRHGLTFYPGGFHPPSGGPPATLSNTKSYRNAEDGILFQSSTDVTVDGGTFADNRIGIEIDKGCDSITVSGGADVVGFSDEYQAIVTADVGVKSHCPAYRPLVGVQLHAFGLSSGAGFVIDDVTFRNFDGDLTGCVDSTAIDFDPETTNGGHQTVRTRLGPSVTFNPTDGHAVDLCMAAEAGILDVVIEDASGAANPAGDGTPGFILSNSTAHAAFVDGGGCTAMEGSCALYCPSSCLRTVRVAFNPNDNMVAKMEVSDGITTVEYPTFFETKKETDADGNVVDSVYANTGHQRRKMVSATLPKPASGGSGTYTLKLKTSAGHDHWPGFVEYSLGDVPEGCAEGTYATETEIVMPPIDPELGSCTELIKNGDLEEDTTGNYAPYAGDFAPWLHAGGGLVRVAGGADSTGHALSTVDRANYFNGPAQFLDSRCLTPETEYEVVARFRLEIASTGVPFTCDPVTSHDPTANGVCPRASLRLTVPTEGRTSHDVNYAYPIAQTLVSPAVTSTEDWQTMHGYFTVGPSIASADGVMFFIDRVKPDVNIIVDKISVVESSRTCEYPIYNYDFETGDTRNWYVDGYFGENTAMEVVSPGADGVEGGYAVKLSGRPVTQTSVSTDINTDCIASGETYTVSAKIKLEKDGAAYDCDPGLVWGVATAGVCPKMIVKATTGGAETVEDVASVISTFVPGAWNRLDGAVTWTDAQVNADRLQIIFEKYEKGVDIYVDDVLLVPDTEWDCSQLIRNGDAESGNSRYWGNYAGAQVSLYEWGGANGTDGAIMGANRPSQYSGMSQFLDTSCMNSDTVYEVSAQVKLLDGDGNDVDCDPLHTSGDLQCPVAAINAQNPGAPPQRHTVASVKSESWTTGAWNEIGGYFTFLDNELEAASSIFVVYGAAPGVTIVVDEITVKSTAY